MAAPGGDDSPAGRKAMNGSWKVVIVGGGFGGLSAANRLLVSDRWAIQDLTFSRGTRLIIGSAPKDFDFDREMARAQHEPAHPALQR